MNIVVLTTDTTHHTYFVWKLNALFPLQAVFLETDHLAAPFDIAHPYLREQEEYEKRELLAGFDKTISDITDTYSFASMNDTSAVLKLAELAPEVVLVFGTGLLKKPIISVASRACLNLHGGHPEEYRGLDNHLWAIYHDDFAKLVTTLHYVDAELDTGDIVLQEKLVLRPGMLLHELRAVNTRACVNLCALAVTSLDRFDWLPSRMQIKRGRYYSFMPSELKEICRKKFAKHTARLPQPKAAEPVAA